MRPCRVHAVPSTSDRESCPRPVLGAVPQGVCPAVLPFPLEGVRGSLALHGVVGPARLAAGLPFASDPLGPSPRGQRSALRGSCAATDIPRVRTAPARAARTCPAPMHGAMPRATCRFPDEPACARSVNATSVQRSASRRAPPAQPASSAMSRLVAARCTPRDVASAARAPPHPTEAAPPRGRCRCGRQRPNLASRRCIPSGRDAWFAPRRPDPAGSPRGRRAEYRGAGNAVVAGTMVRAVPRCDAGRGALVGAPCPGSPAREIHLEGPPPENRAVCRNMDCAGIAADVGTGSLR